MKAILSTWDSIGITGLFWDSSRYLFEGFCRSSTVELLPQGSQWVLSCISTIWFLLILLLVFPSIISSELSQKILPRLFRSSRRIFSWPSWNFFWKFLKELFLEYLRFFFPIISLSSASKNIKKKCDFYWNSKIGMWSWIFFSWISTLVFSGIYFRFLFLRFYLEFVLGILQELLSSFGLFSGTLCAVFLLEMFLWFIQECLLSFLQIFLLGFLRSTFWDFRKSFLSNSLSIFYWLKFLLNSFYWFPAMFFFITFETQSEIPEEVLSEISQFFLGSCLKLVL